MPSDTKITNAIEKELLGATNLQRRKKENDQQYFYRVIEAVNVLPDEEWEKLSEEAQDWVNEGIDAIKSNDPISDFPAIPVVEEEEEPLEEDEEKAAPDEKDADAPKGKASAPDEELTEEEEEALEALDELEKTLDGELGEDEEEGDEENEEGEDDGDLEADLEKDIKAIRVQEKKAKEDKPKKKSGGKATGRVHRHAEATKKVAKKGNKTSEQRTGKPSGQTRIKQILAERGLDLASEEIYFQLRTEGYEYARSTIDVIKSDFRNSCRVLSEMGLLKGMEQ